MSETLKQVDSNGGLLLALLEAVSLYAETAEAAGEPLKGVEVYVTVLDVARHLLQDNRGNTWVRGNGGMEQAKALATLVVAAPLDQPFSLREEGEINPITIMDPSTLS
jgi:hypothetical protein